MPVGFHMTHPLHIQTQRQLMDLPAVLCLPCLLHIDLLCVLVLVGMSDDLCGSVRRWREHSGVCHCGGGVPAGNLLKLHRCCLESELKNNTANSNIRYQASSC